jgi:DNA polymerase-3 subunit epsilon/ATP-dependent DNA helicase DinG
LQSLRGKVSEKRYQKLEGYVREVVRAVKEMGSLVDGYFRHLLNHLQQFSGEERTEYVIYVRITDETRQQADWASIQTAWERLSRYTETVSVAMEAIARGLKDLRAQHENDIPDYDDIVSSVQTASDHLKDIHELLEQFNIKPHDNTIYWCEISPDGEQVTIRTAPLHIGYLIEDHLWNSKNTAILTSATMSTSNSFEFIRERLSAPRAVVKDLTLESPFDYKNSTLLFIPTDIPEPNIKDRYQLAIERAIIEMATVLNGRTMALFTSYTHLRQTAQNITPRLKLGGITLYDQTSGSSRQLLIDSFKSTEKAVLLGTRSFWEGVDLPGDDLYGLVITRLPFSVPTDPIFSARSETFENSFLQFAVPEAILLFRQGFGRLIRRRTDRGVVVILDKRIISKRYGQAFLDSLPDCTVHQGSLAQLSSVTQKWMNR